MSVGISLSLMMEVGGLCNTNRRQKNINSKIISVAILNRNFYICTVKNLFKKIFSVYILVLVFIPCSDSCLDRICNNSDNIHLEQSAEDFQNDVCTPMCTCICCNTIVTVSENFTFENFTHNSNFSIQDISKFTNSFLENTSPPPKS